MKKNLIMIGVIVALLLGAIVMVNSRKAEPPVVKEPVAEHAHPHTPAPPADGPKVLPAFLKEAPSASSLGPTLAPEKFTGLTRDAYRAVREIPVTIAQMPCYCHCDRGFGHKSLYSCFEDDHAAHCAVCVNEALLAHKLEKEEKLSPAQIRDRIVAQFGN